ncbi:MAG: hypothetical protein LUQ53_04260, partial [Methanothrix sp.]|nr:hypothetical protein [Methanothrix sp.]
SLFARCWFAVKSDPEATRRVFVQSVLQLLDERDGRIGLTINRTLFAWDGKAKTDKNHKDKGEEYDRCRRKIQEDLYTLFDTVHGYHKEYEADDIVATAVFNSTARQVFVVSGDKDLMQLQGGNVSYYCLNSKAVVPSRTICHKFCVKRPSQVALALAIIGDANDGISGVPRWGPKKSEKLFEAVTEAMNFESALATIQAQIPEDLLPYFLDSLDKTLLHNDVPGVPEPAELRFCTTDELMSLGIEKIAQGYERVAMQYEGGNQEEAMAAMLKRPTDSPSARRAPE